MTNADRRIILSCFANGFEFRKGMEQAKMAEVKTLDGVEIFTVDYMNRLAEMLCNALEKQVPKLVRNYKLGYMRSVANCPCCNSFVSIDDYGHRDAYCFKCGQAILWEDE